MEPLPPTLEALQELLSLGDTKAARELLRIGRQVQEVVPDCVGVSLGLHDDRWTFTLVATSELALEMDAVQYIDDGPCVTAMDTGDTIATTADELFDEGRWLMFARAQAASGIKSTLSLPIMREGRVVAGVNLYASTPEAFDGHHAELSVICRAWEPGVIANADLSFSTRLEAAATPSRMQDRYKIDQAIGMLMQTRGIDVTTAADLLRNAAVRARVTEIQAAEIVIRLLSSR